MEWSNTAIFTHSSPFQADGTLFQHLAYQYVREKSLKYVIKVFSVIDILSKIGVLVLYSGDVTHIQFHP